MNIHEQVKMFAAQWEKEEGYKPATFQKAIAMQRLERGQSIREIIDALIAQRVETWPESVKRHETAHAGMKKVLDLD